MKKEAPKIKVVKTAPRKYRLKPDGVDEIVAPTEYAVTDGNKQLGIIIKAQDGWRACKPTAESRIGVAVSPVGLDCFRAVRDWALKYFAPPHQDISE